MGLRTLILSLLLFTVAACAPARPVVESAPFELPESFSITTAPLNPETVDSGEWWKEFGDARLNELMQETFNKNLNIAMAYERVKASRAVLGVAGSKEGVELNAAAYGGQRRVAGVTADSYKLSGSASYELDVWKKLSAGTEAALNDMAATTYDLHSVYLTLCAELVGQYYVAVERSLQLEIIGLMIKTAEQKLVFNKERYAEGLITAHQLFLSEEGVAVVRARVPAIETQRANASHAVAILTGNLPSGIISGINTNQPVPHELPTLLPSTLVNRRPDLQAALHRVKANNSRVAAAIADRFPSFSLTGEYGGTSLSLNSMLSSSNILWNFLLQATAPVIDGGRRKAEVARTEALFNESLIGYRLALLNALKDVEGALVENSAAVTTFSLARKRVDAASGALDLAVARYRNGVGDYLDLLTGQQRYYEAKSELLGVKRNLISARIGLVRSLGGDFMDGLVLKNRDM